MIEMKLFIPYLYTKFTDYIQLIAVYYENHFMSISLLRSLGYV